MFVIVMMIPIIGCFSLYIGTGGELKGLPIGIVNGETANVNECFNQTLVTAEVQGHKCRLNKISCRFIDELQGEYIDRVRMKSLKFA